MTSPSDVRVPLWRDDRFWKIAFQAVVAALVLGFFAFMLNNLDASLERQGLEFSFRFLRNAAGYSIGESILPYTPSNSYFRAILVGLVNTLRLILVGFVLTTLLGVLAGTASFSSNWLVRKLSEFYVTVIRNTPLLLQLIFWYFPFLLQLPRDEQRLALPGSIFASKTGIYVPWPTQDALSLLCLAALVALAVAAWFMFQQRIKVMVERGETGKRQQNILIGMGIAALLIFLVAFRWQFPTVGEANRISGGLRVSLEYMAILLGLVVYTGAFIAEIVRGGIESVSKGQWEAARSLGLRPGQVMQLVVFPQALRVIIPPLNSQYMNLAKNSSLALVIGYPDLFSVASTALNQTGRPVEMFIILMASYLLINLLISVFMNLLNESVQFKER